MTRKPAFWISLAILGTAGAILAVRLFPSAFPLLSVNIEMDREGALEQARALVEEHEWDPAEFRQAASFGHLDPAFQTYMELEGGGLEELNRLVSDGSITLYAWRVRHFAEETVEEAEVRFTPQGIRHGFRLILSEGTPGTNLEPDQAQARAVQEASADWGMDPTRYRPLESSQEEQPGGRLDHTFVFERVDLLPGEARIRLRLRMAGDQLVEVTSFFHVPEAFLRRYQETRNANESLSLAGTIVFLVFFLILGGGAGTLHLLKKRWIEWRAPLIWGAVVAGLMALGAINTLPLSWMEYNTAIPSQVHIANVVLMAALTFGGGTIFLALLFMTGEGLIRIGFPEEIQLWKFWKSGVANSAQALGRTAAPYLVVGVELGFVVAFYLVTTGLLGWWSPASALVEPDLLATRFPWLTAVSTSLFAALSEETVFRAIPIGAAAIIGRRYGRPWLWIWGAVILQALVFGASHANYPQQPAYARIVEISPTYLAWGISCVFFGLVPTIIAHYLYDLVLFSLPLFAAEVSGIWLDRSFVIVAGLLPLGLVLMARLRQGGVPFAPEWALNRSWVPRKAAPPEEDGAGAEDHRVPGSDQAETLRPSAAGLGEEPGQGDAIGFGDRILSPTAKGLLAFLGIAGLASWMSGLDTVDSPQLTLTRAQAGAEAVEALEARGIRLGPEWTPLFSVSAERPSSHRFVWEKGSEEEYRATVGTFLNSPGWRVRFLGFGLPPEERAETYTVAFHETGSSPRIIHEHPEERAGATMSEDDARALALEAANSQLGLNPGTLREVSADETARPNRTDWTFIFSDAEGYPLAEGEGRVRVRIAGDEVVGVGRFVHVPEEWGREWQAESSRRQLPPLVAAGIMGLLAVGALVLAIVKWARGSLLTDPFRVVSLTVAVAFLASGINEWPGTIGIFTTQLSFGNQAAMVVLGIGLGSLLMGLSVGLMASLGHTWIQGNARKLSGSGMVGLAVGMILVGASSLLFRLGPEGPPGWPDYSGAVAYLSWMSVALGALIQYVTLTSVLLLLLGALKALGETRWAWAGAPLTLLVGLTLASNPPGTGWYFWIGTGAAISLGIGLFWVLCRRLGWAILPGAAAVPVLLGLLETAMRNPFPGSWVGAAMGAFAVAMGTTRWTKAL
ncbi:MAG: type II CAAX endopeptidase family protein [Gemmatimonadota bacterium]|jgi:membrane protease YdiL (CAAX protease family)